MVSAILIGVVVTLLAAALIGAFTLLRARVTRAVHARHPVDISIDVIVREPWRLAFDKAMPPEAREIEGQQIPNTKVYDWLRGLGAVDVEETRLRVSLRSLSEETVVVRDIRVEIDRAAPFAGTAISCHAAGANSASLLVFELDEEAPVAWEWREDGAIWRVGDAPFFEQHNVTLAQNEVHDFIIFGRANNILARWKLLFDLEVGRHHETITVDDYGEGFVTTGLAADGFLESLDWAWYRDNRFTPTPSHDW